MSHIPDAVGRKNIRRRLFGRPIPTSEAHHERLSSLLGLPEFEEASRLLGRSLQQPEPRGTPL